MTASRSPQSTRSGYEASNVEYGFGSRRQDSKPEHCRRINRQIRNTLRYKQYTLCNVDSELHGNIPKQVCLRAWLRVHSHLNGCITLFCLQSVTTGLSDMNVVSLPNTKGASYHCYPRLGQLCGINNVLVLHSWSAYQKTKQ